MHVNTYLMSNLHDIYSIQFTQFVSAQTSFLYILQNAW